MWDSSAGKVARWTCARPRGLRNSTWLPTKKRRDANDRTVYLRVGDWDLSGAWILAVGAFVYCFFSFSFSSLIFFSTSSGLITSILAPFFSSSAEGTLIMSLVRGWGEVSGGGISVFSNSRSTISVEPG